jgi:hypothetical protein
MDLFTIFRKTKDSTRLPVFEKLDAKSSVILIFRSVADANDYVQKRIAETNATGCEVDLLTYQDVENARKRMEQVLDDHSIYLKLIP